MADGWITGLLRHFFLVCTNFSTAERGVRGRGGGSDYHKAPFRAREATKSSHIVSIPHQSIATLKNCLCEQVCFSGGHFAEPVMSRLREWHLLRAPIGPATWNCSHHGLDTSLALLCNKTDFSFGANVVSFCRQSHMVKQRQHSDIVALQDYIS